MSLLQDLEKQKKDKIKDLMEQREFYIKYLEKVTDELKYVYDIEVQK